LTYTASQAIAAPFLRRPDVLISTSPSFPGLLPAIANVRLRGIPWILWIHDLLPEGATATGLVSEDGLVMRLSRRLERAAYDASDRIVVLSRAFTENLVSKGVPGEKIELIYDPATREPTGTARPGCHEGGLRLLSIGNIGHSQGLAEFVRAFDSQEHPQDAAFVITGTGVAADDAKSEIKSRRVKMLGMVDDLQLERELLKADIAFVSQRYSGSEFNIPSKLMNFMAYGLPVLAAVNPEGEVARIVNESGGGWVLDSSDPSVFPTTLMKLSESRAEIAERAASAHAYAQRHFTRMGFASQFERVLQITARVA
jgi:colanic acid biosynthesis glycosyl transferase WcaI